VVAPYIGPLYSHFYSGALEKSHACIDIAVQSLIQEWVAGRQESLQFEAAFQLLTLLHVAICRDNVEDAMEKLQACLDNAAQSLIPVEVDPEKIKQLNKQ